MERTVPRDMAESAVAHAVVTVPGAPVSRRRRRSVRWAIVPAAWAATLALAGLNARWLWEARTLPDLRAINAMIAANDLAGAESALWSTLRRSPHDGDARTALARVLAARGDTRGCAEQLDRVPFWWPTKADALYREGQAWMEIHRARDAERAWLTYLADDPNHPVDRPYYAKAETNLLNLYALEDRWSEAERLVLQSLRRAATRDARRELGLLLIRTRFERSHPKAAVGTLSKYVAADPADYEARLALARAQVGLERRSEARSNLEECLRRRPKDPRVWRELVALAAGSGDKQAVDQVLAVVPPETAETEASIQAEIARRARDRGDYARAEAAFAKAAKLEPSEPDYLYNRSLALSRLGRASEAAALQPKLAAMRKAVADLTDAINAYRDATALEPPKDAPRPSVAARKLARVCRDLNWVAQARVWSSLADEEARSEAAPTS